MKILELLEKIEQVVQKKEVQTYIESEVSILKNEYRIESVEEIQNELKRLEDDNRLLKIGIIGRVKAGKSSLINAILFEGKDILPKAATPMTAALTQISYEESLQAEIEFFSQTDIENIKKEYNEYLKKFQKEKEEAKQGLKDKISKNPLKKLSDSEIEKKAHRIVKEKFKEISFSYDQYKEMESSGVLSSTIPETKILESENIEDLKKQLEDYVGSGGKYMPFTKAVLLKMNKEDLKDIEVVDTPGLNDPVVSRVERTKQMLKKCEVTFVVSPAGQFLSSEDTSLMDRISTKEGVSEIYVVASRVDQQLYGDEKRKGGGELPRVLNGITDKLGKHLVTTLTQLKKDRPVIGNLFDELIQQGKEKILYSSGICETIRQNFDHLDTLDDETAHHAWKNLKEGYPHAFSDRDKTTSLANLESLANTEKIKETLEKVRKAKDKILQEKKENTLKAKENSIQEYYEKLIERIQQSLQELQSGNIEKNQKQIDNAQKNRKAVEEQIDEFFEDSSYSFITSIQEETKNIVQKSYDEVKNKIRHSQEEKERTGTRTTTISVRYKNNSWKNFWGWFGDRYSERPEERQETYHYTEFQVRAGDIRDGLISFQEDIHSRVETEFRKAIEAFKKKLNSQVSNKFQELSENDKTGTLQDIEISKIKKAIRKVIQEIQEPEMEEQDLPADLDIHRTLKGSEARDFLREAKSYMSDLQKNLRSDLKASIKKIENEFRNVNLTENIFDSYEKELKRLQEQLKDKEKSEKKYKEIIQELKNIK